ncbi:MAG: sacsin N-terminal ATP-binding-like domain-containing protein [Mycobacteriales bacterium]
MAAWAASPARFREDANAEDDLALGGYRDRLVVELAQNAADAAQRAGVPGRLLLRLTGDTLVAANTGAALDASGVVALSTLRASAKRGESSTGRFGVGFAAVLAVTDQPAVHSSSGGVRWSRPDAAAAVAELPALAAELARRGGRAPVLRLPWPATGEPPRGHDTVVVLPLRDAGAAALVRRLLAEIDPTLLLVLAHLAELEIEVDGRVRRLAAERDVAGVVIDDDGERTRWRVAGRTGRLSPALLADRPVEERERPVWSVSWALPLDGAGVPVSLPGTVPAVVHAPTPTDERLSLPAVLAASLPLDPSRRHVAPGALRDFLLAQAAEAYADLLAELAPAPTVLGLVPVGLAAGEVDAALRRGILDRLVHSPFLAAAADPAVRLRPADAIALDLAPPVVDVLAPVLSGLLPADWAAQLAPLAVLGVRRLGPAELVELLAGLSREPVWWRQLYDALGQSHLGGPERDALGALPVPLADGGSASQPRGVLLPGPDVPAAVLTALGLRVAHPDATSPLLRLLGAVEATPRSVLEHPRVRAAVATSYDAEDPAPLADAVLTLVRAAGLSAGEMPALAELALPGEDGEWYPAGELLLPGGPLAALVDADAPFGVVEAGLVDRWGAETLVAAGVLATFAVLREADVALEPAHDLDGEEDWVTATGVALPSAEVPPMLAELVAVRDLELVRADRWPAALRLLAEPPLRAAVTDPALALLADGGRVPVRSYTAWWLSAHPVLGGRCPVELRLPDSDPLLEDLYDEAPGGADPAWLRATGVLATLEDADPDDVLDRLGDPSRPLPRRAVREIHARLAESGFVGSPERVRAVRDGVLAVVPAADAVVVDAADLRPLLGRRVVVPAPLSLARAVADLLDVALASELSAYVVTSTGHEQAVPAVAAELVAGLPSAYVEHAPLVVADADGRPVCTTWRVVDGVVHAQPDGLGAALAWAAGRWADRWALAAVLRDPAALGDLLDDADLDG